MKSNSNTRFIVRAALLAALAIVFQHVGRMVIIGPNSNFLVGPLVNACLIIATMMTGIWGGVFVSIITPIVALVQGAVPIPLLTPIIMAGNLGIVCMFHLFRKQPIIGVLIAALAKFAIIFAASSILLNLVGNIPPKVIETVQFVFSWPQLVTAIVGGYLALLIVKMMPKQFH